MKTVTQSLRETAHRLCIALLCVILSAGQVFAGCGMLLCGAGSRGTAFTPASLIPNWWFEARNYPNFFQSNAGSGAAPAVNGDVIGFIPDQSGSGITLTSAANTAVRPVLAGVGTFPAVTCTAANSTIISNSTALNSYNAGSSSWFFAFKSNASAVSTYLAAEGHSTEGNTIYSMMAAWNVTASTAVGQIRNAAGTNLMAASTAVQSLVFNGSDHVFGIVDNGTTITPWLDGVAGSAVPYTASRTGVVLVDRFALCGLLRNVAGGAAFWNGNIYGGVIVNRVLNSTEISNLSTYLATLF